MIIYEIESGKLNAIDLAGPEQFVLGDASYLLIEPISEHYLCVTNSFLNKSIVIRTEDWHGAGSYPNGFEAYVGYPNTPLKVIDVPEKTVRLYEKTATFIIVLSYDCNLRCKYCYQQCNENLDRSTISEEKLSSILNTIVEYHCRHPEKAIHIGLFGGEPLLPENHENIIRIFDFCVENRFSVSITTNGVNLPYYIKDLVIYSGLNITVGTTVDSISKNEATRFSQSGEGDSRSASILHSVYTLINNGVSAAIEMNIDKHNINEIDTMLDFYQKNGFLDNPLFELGIGLVDDRRYEIGYQNMISEPELIQKLTEIENLHERVYFAFVKSPLNLCRKLYPGFRQNEMKYCTNYCWASAPFDYVFYIDSDLDVFRCPYSVGRKEYSLFKFSIGRLESYKLPDQSYIDFPGCEKCQIGGFCSGGCSLSRDVDFQRMCEEEKRSFSSFLAEVYYPRVRSLAASL